METKKQKIVSAIATIGIVLTLFGATYAYFASRVDAGKITDVEITANTVDVLTFETGDPITLSLDQENFAAGTGNQTGSTFAKATLSANNKTNTATEHYYLFLNIESNSFTYSKDSDHPEILVKITDSDGNELVDSDVDGLTHKTVVDAKGNTVTGFDVTTKTGMVTILNNREITTTSTKSETWTFTFTFVNYDFNQADNAGNNFKASVMIQKELLLAQWVEGLYTGVQGENNIYYHDSTLANGAEDNSYRFSGADWHEETYTCVYNDNKVYSKQSPEDNNSSYQGDCAKVYATTFNENEVYVDKSVYESGTTVTWNNEDNKCTTAGGDEMIKAGGGAPTESECTGSAYMVGGTYFLMTLTEAGAGTATLYQEAGGVDNNYVCFGSTETPCPYENLYRIIGVIDGKTRLIKADVAKSSLLGTDGDYWGEFYDTWQSLIPEINTYHNMYYKGNIDVTEIGAYSWNYQNDTSINSGYGSNTWSTSLLNKTNLNTNFLNNIGTEWANKIEMTTWKVGGISDNGNSQEIYQNEIVNPESTNTTDGKTTYDAKVGLMYISDYGYAYENSHWTENVLNSSNGSSLYNNWMQIGTFEWTISRAAVSAYNVVALVYGTEYGDDSAFPLGVRPSFNLTSSVKIVGGDGHKASPLVIN